MLLLPLWHKNKSSVVLKKYNIEDINGFVAGKTRSGDRLDFQLADRLIPGNDKKELWLSKYVSAFANSVGGTIIFGIKSYRGRASEIFGVDFKKVSSFWLMNLLENEISPKIENLEVYEIPFTENTSMGVVVVNVPQSLNRPHMASDKRFYQRSKLHEELMDEIRVRELYNLASTPDMEFVGIVNTQGVPALENGQFINLNFYPKFLVKNAGSAVEKIFKFELWLPSELHDPAFSPLQNFFNRLEGSYSVFSVPNRQPVFQGEICNILEAKLFVNNENFHSYFNDEMKIKLYYSRGLKEFSYKLNETFTYDNKYISKTDFVSIPEYNNKVKNNIL